MNSTTWRALVAASILAIACGARAQAPPAPSPSSGPPDWSAFKAQNLPVSYWRQGAERGWEKQA